MSNLKYLAFVKQSGSLPVYGLSLDKTLDESLKQQVPKNLCLVKQERQRIKSQYGCWFCKKDDRGLYYIALCSQNYPERHIYAAINQLRDHLSKLGDYQNQADGTLKLHAKDVVSQIAKKYDNLKGIDKIGEANKMLDEIKDNITDNTLKLMNNTANLEGLQKKADSLRENAQMFEVSATQVEREMWCRNCKMKVIIAVVIVALLCVIIIPIVTTLKK